MARRISVTVKPNAHIPAVMQLGELEFRVAVREPARDGKANAALVELLARHFGMPKSAITIVRGHASGKKIVELT